MTLGGTISNAGLAETLGVTHSVPAIGGITSNATLAGVVGVTHSVPAVGGITSNATMEEFFAGAPLGALLVEIGKKYGPKIIDANTDLRDRLMR